MNVSAQPPRVFNPRTCALGCGLPVLILTGLIVSLVIRDCPGEVARWTGRPEGTIVVAPGMTKDQVRQRSTTTIAQYGDSGRFVTFVLASEGIELRGIQQFLFDSEPDGRIQYVNMITANESWPGLLRSAKKTEELLLRRGWRPYARQPAITSLPSDPEDAADGVTGSGAIAGSDFWYRKGRQRFHFAAGGLWSGIPFGRNPARAEVFWRNMTYYPMGDPFEISSPK